MAEPICRLVLIHGTWARRASWINKDSTFSEQLARVIGHPIEIVPFRWSGANTFSARRSAALALRQLLKESNWRRPTFLVAHSHGGNVVLQALVDSAVRSAVRGSVFMATPFLNVRKRRISKFAGVTTVAAIGVASFITLIVLFSIWLFQARIWPVSLSVASWRTQELLVQGLVVSTAVLLLLPAYWWTSWAYKKLDQCGLPPLQDHKSLVVRTAGDEASTVLTALALANVVVTMLWTSLAWTIYKVLNVYRWFKQVLWDRFVLMRAGLITLFTIWFIHAYFWQAQLDAWRMGLGDYPRSTSVLEFGSLVSIALVAPLAILTLLLALIAAISTLLLAVFLLPFGLDLIPAAGLAEVTVETGPSGETESFISMEDSEVNPEAGSPWLSLAHSAVYGREDCIRAIGEWIRIRVSSTNTATSLSDMGN